MVFLGSQKLNRSDPRLERTLRAFEIVSVSDSYKGKTICLVGGAIDNLQSGPEGSKSDSAEHRVFIDGLVFPNGSTPPQGFFVHVRNLEKRQDFSKSYGIEELGLKWVDADLKNGVRVQFLSLVDPSKFKEQEDAFAKESGVQSALQSSGNVLIFGHHDRFKLNDEKGVKLGKDDFVLYDPNDPEDDIGEQFNLDRFVKDQSYIKKLQQKFKDDYDLDDSHMRSLVDACEKTITRRREEISIATSKAGNCDMEAMESLVSVRAFHPGLMALKYDFSALNRSMGFGPNIIAILHSGNAYQLVYEADHPKVVRFFSASLPVR